MIRAVVVLTIFIFALSVYFLAAGPALEETGNRTQDNEAVQDLEMNGTVDTVYDVTFMWVPALLMAVITVWFALFVLRIERFIGGS